MLQLDFLVYMFYIYTFPHLGRGNVSLTGESFLWAVFCYILQLEHVNDWLNQSNIYWTHFIFNSHTNDFRLYMHESRKYVLLNSTRYCKRRECKYVNIVTKRSTESWLFHEIKEVKFVKIDHLPHKDIQIRANHFLCICKLYNRISACMKGVVH